MIDHPDYEKVACKIYVGVCNVLSESYRIWTDKFTSQHSV